MNALDTNTAVLIGQAVAILGAIWKATTWLAARVDKLSEKQNTHTTRIAVIHERLDALEELHAHCPTAHAIAEVRPGAFRSKERD